MKYQLINENPSIENPLQQFLYNRGVIGKTPQEFFNLDWDCVQPPSALDNIDAGMELLIKHCEAGHTIAVLVDTDADGMTSAALLFNYLNDQKKYGAFKDYTYNLVPVFHPDKKHGLEDTVIMRKIRDEVKPELLVIPDASGKAEQYQALIDLGIEILVLDHHEDMVSEMSTGTVVIINNQQSENYKNKDLSGVGVVYQFCRALEDRLVNIDVDRYLYLVAIGMVGDVMNLQSDETRFLCFAGMQQRESSFLDALFFKLDYRMHGIMSPFTIGWYISPLFNAVCRIGSMEEREIAFKALIEGVNDEMVPDGTRGHTGEVDLASEALRLMSNCKGRHDTRKKKLAGQIDEYISKKKLFNDKVIVVKIDDYDDMQRSMSGVVANELCGIYHRPCILLFKNDDKHSYAGSVRVPEHYPIYENFKDQCNDSGLVIFASGHQAAFGIGVETTNIDALIDYFNNKYADVSTDIFYNVDYIFDANDVNAPAVCEALASLKDYAGQGIETPTVVIKDVPLKRSMVRMMGKDTSPTLKILLPNRMECIKFWSSTDEYNSLIAPYDGGAEQFYTADIIGTCEINEYAGKETIQIKISDYEVKSGATYDF